VLVAQPLVAEQEVVYTQEMKLNSHQNNQKLVDCKQGVVVSLVAEPEVDTELVLMENNLRSNQKLAG
jgi:hypothetical protein